MHNELHNIKTDGVLAGKARAINTQILTLNVTPIGQVKICCMLLAEAMRRLFIRQALNGKDMSPRDMRLMEEAMWAEFKVGMRKGLNQPAPSTEAHDPLRGAAHVMESGELDPGSPGLAEHPPLRDDDPVHQQPEEDTNGQS